MKTINQQIFERVLEPMFPGQFKAPSSEQSEREYNSHQTEYDYENNLEDAFWLAEKVGLFHHGYVLGLNINGYVILNLNLSNNIIKEIANSDSIPEAICNAVLSVYGSKE